MKKLIPILTLAAVVISALYWWQSKPSQTGVEGLKTTGLPMKVAEQYWPGHFWITIAKTKGWLAEAGLNVEIINVDENFMPSLKDFVEGKIDSHHPVLFDFIKYNLSGANLVAVAVTDLSLGGDGIAAQKEIAHLRDLRGKRVGVEKETFAEFVLHEALKRVGMLPNDIISVNLKSETIEPFISGDIEALVTWEPFLSDAIHKAGGRLIFDTSQIPGVISDVIAFHQSFIDERPGDVQAYLNVWHKTTKFIKNHPDEAFEIIAKKNQVPLKEVRDFTVIDKILDLRDNIESFRFGVGFDSLHGSIRRINNHLIKTGIADKQLDSTEFLDPQFIRRLQ